MQQASNEQRDLFKSVWLYNVPMTGIGGIFAYLAWHRTFAGLKSKQAPAMFFMYTTVRYLRTVPIICMAMIILFSMPSGGELGPIHDESLHRLTDQCMKTGWAEFLGVTNFLDPQNIVRKGLS